MKKKFAALLAIALIVGIVPSIALAVSSNEDCVPAVCIAELTEDGKTIYSAEENAEETNSVTNPPATWIADVDEENLPSLTRASDLILDKSLSDIETSRGSGSTSFKRPSQTLCKPPMWCRIEAPHWRFYISLHIEMDCIRRILVQYIQPLHLFLRQL